VLDGLGNVHRFGLPVDIVVLVSLCIKIHVGGVNGQIHFLIVRQFGETVQAFYLFCVNILRDKINCEAIPPHPFTTSYLSEICVHVYPQKMGEIKMAKDETKRYRHLKDKLPEEARDHLREARGEWQQSIRALFPVEFFNHRRAARKEMLLAARSLIDAAVKRMDPEE
jgi:hypothetical protein